MFYERTYILGATAGLGIVWQYLSVVQGYNGVRKNVYLHDERFFVDNVSSGSGYGIM